MNDAFDVVKKNHKERVTYHEGVRDRAMRRFVTNTKEEEAEVRVIKDYKLGKVWVQRVDTGEDVEFRDMTKEELSELPLSDGDDNNNDNDNQENDE